MRDLAGIHVGHFLHRLEPFRGEQLGDHLVDVEGLHEALRALGELLLAPLRLLLLGEDVDVPAGELRGSRTFCPRRPMASESWLLGHHHLDAVGVLVQHHLGDLGRRQRIDDEGGRIRVPLDDVHLLALQLADHGLHALAAHADAGAHRIDGAILGDDGDLGPGSGIARHRLDLHDAVVDLGHFLGEQLRHELGPGARKKDLGPRCSRRTS
jgi:hypothetical protein